MKKALAVFVIAMFFSSCDFKSAKDYLSEAEKLSLQTNYKGAIKLLDKAIEKDPNYIGAFINRGADKSALGDFEGAVVDYEQVLKIDPKNTLALFNIGNNYKRINNYQKAIVYYDKALESKGGQNIYMDYNPDSYVENKGYDVEGNEIILERAIAYFYTGNLQKSFDELNFLLNKNQRPAECHYWIGHIYLSEDKKELACENFIKSQRLGDKDAGKELIKYCNEK